MFNLDDLTLGQLKEINKMLQSNTAEIGLGNIPVGAVKQNFDDEFLGKKVIIRTYSAGVWFGTLKQKDKNEVILSNARRMWRWWAAESISLSAVAIYGIKQEESKIVEAVESVWLDAIEILSCTEKAILSIESAPNVKAN